MPSVGRLSERVWCSSDRQLGVHHMRYNPGDFQGLPHTHAEYNIVFCVSGRMRFLVEGRPEILRPGDILIINPGELHIGHYGTARRGCDGIGLAITERRLRDLLGSALIPPALTGQALGARGAVSESGRFQLRAMVRELLERKSGYEVALDCCAKQLLLELFRGQVTVVGHRRAPPVGPQLTSWEMVDAIEYMSGEGKSAFNLPTLCSRLGTSPSRFTRLFKNSSGISPQAYFNETTIARAKKLLQDRERPVKEVAYDLGFRNDSHFCRLFRRVAGLSPQRYQAAIRRSASRSG